MVDILIVLVGLAGIIKSADIFIEQAIALAKKYKISSFIIGFTIVAFGTSLPELIISSYATVIGHTTFAISNVLGSNIANISLILPILALIKPFRLSLADVKKNIPMAIYATLGFLLLALTSRNNELGLFIGMLLIAIFLLILWYTSRKNHSTTLVSNALFHPITMSLALAALMFFGKLTVDHIFIVSKTFGIAESLFGYFLVALATSMPELITTMAALRKGNDEVGLGNILGSNLFNLFFILGSSSIITPLVFAPFMREILLILIATVLLLVLALQGKRYYIERSEAFLLFCLYLVFMALHLQ